MLEIIRRPLFSFGLNATTLTSQTKACDILGFIKTLWPQDCGIDLIRVGANGDGGYLIPNDLEGIEYCFSPGVGTLSEFENQLADRQIKCFLADYSVDSLPTIRPEFTFDKKFLGASDSDRCFTLASWKNKYLKGYEGDLILQMDIEDAEYVALLCTPTDLLKQFRIIVVEFHGLNRLFDRFDFLLISSCFQKLLEHFYVCHIHPNNCTGSVRRGNIEVPRVLEITFINKKRVSKITPKASFPHRLDGDIVETIPPLDLPKSWYSQV